MFKRCLAVFLLSTLLSTAALAGFDEGKQAYDKGNWIQAILNLRPMVEAGDSRAMILLGNMYMDGHGVGQDAKEAFSLYHQAALMDNTDGMVAVGVLYKKGEGILANTPLAIGWFERAARMGNQLAGFVYAINLYQGSHGPSFDIKPDAEASYRWFKIVAANGPDKKLQQAAVQAAALVAKKLVTDEIAKGDRESANWKPEMPKAIGPDPEQKMAAELKENKDKDNKNGESKAIPDQSPAEDHTSMPVPPSSPDKQPATPSPATGVPAANDPGPAPGNDGKKPAE